MDAAGFSGIAVYTINRIKKNGSFCQHLILMNRFELTTLANKMLSSFFVKGCLFEMDSGFRLSLSPEMLHFLQSQA
jgi:hypothetical protein